MWTPKSVAVACFLPGLAKDLPASLYNGYRVFPGGKVRPGRDADSSLPSSDVVKNRVEL
jgi:hypothetical protein